MKIAIIGAGNVGSAICQAATDQGHDVVLSEVADEAEKLAEAMDAETAESNAAAVREAETIVLAVPFGAVDEVAGDIREAVSGKIVIDATNPLREDYSGLATENGPSAAERLQKLLPEARVVKAFNTIFAANQAKGEVDGVQLDGFVAGDDAEAKRAVLGLLEEIGFRPIDAGPLESARYLEGMGFLNISLNAANGWSWRTGWKLVGPTE